MSLRRANGPCEAAAQRFTALLGFHNGGTATHLPTTSWTQSVRGLQGGKRCIAVTFTRFVQTRSSSVAKFWQHRVHFGHHLGMPA